MSKRSSHALILSLSVLLNACGGGGGSGAGPEAQATGAEQPARKALAAVPSNIPSDAGSKGMWSALKTWPLVAVHAALLPDGRVLSYGSKNDGQQTGSDRLDLWDNAGVLDTGHNQLANTSGTDLFCGSQLLLPPSDTTTVPSLFMAGGDNYNGTTTSNTGNNNSNVWSSASRSLTRGSDMTRSRWYSSSVTLINGETYIQGGTGGTDRPEVRSAAGSFRSLTSVDTSTLGYMYPRNFVQADGRVFGFDSNGAMYWVSTGGTGILSAAGTFASQYASADNAAAMFRPGRILAFGGNSNGAIVIDVTSGTPVVTATQSMQAQRRLVSATLLPTGDVLATGGSPVWNSPTNASLNAEIWNPASGQWTVGANAARPRLYHSNALLLPDATVLVTGGGAAYAGAVKSPADNELNAQIYYPPYLFTAQGQAAVRPVIQSAPTWLDIGKTFAVTTDSPVSRVVLIKTGSSTHNFNMEQRFIELAFNATGNNLKVQSPTRAGDATPGYYMLFVLNAAGVPSEATMLRVGVAADPNPATVPTLAAVAARTNTVGNTVSLQLAGSDPNGDTLSYSASSLPPGLSLDPATGLISGSPSTAGTYDVVVGVSDGVNSTTRNFVWTVQTAVPLVITTVPTPTATPSGTSVSFTAQATGNGVQYAWNFGDGSADTAWSASNTTTKTYAGPGTYVATLKVRDAAGVLQSRSFLQRIYLPATARAPAASGSLLLEQPASGNARLWVLNPDNDSVTAFDAVTRTKLGEVAVGSGPRSIARASNGLLWVTNKFSASISVIDPATRTVTRTLALPRASQPYGIAVAPTGTTAFIALEAGGQVLRYDTGSYAQTGALDVGLNVRHLSVSFDGATVYASRFITPPMAGESTATVTTGAAEVLQINASTMALAKTWPLAHSDRTDAENQGRGIPNYLGAAVISPDGSQAYVPGKQDNVKRGTLRDGQALNFQNTVRAISARLVLTGTGAGAEDLARRVDHDNASVASAAAFDPRGSMLFVALETSREVAVVDAFSGVQLMRFGVGLAPQGLVVSADGNTLFVHNFMDRTVGVYNLQPLLVQGLQSVPLLATLPTVATDKLSATVLRGKQLFYDAKDTRLARDSYMSCAACHNDGGHDGRTWDLSHAGEGLRNTIALRGRAGLGQGRLHWSANFDEVQDFEAQIRTLAGGTGLMADAAFNAGTRNQPLGDAKAGQSSDLDALAAYVGSLASFQPSPNRSSNGALTSTAQSGRTLFESRCLGCHGGPGFTASASAGLQSIGTIKASSGQRLGGPLTGIDIPTLRDAWATAPYLHDGSAPTISAAITAHANLTLTATEVSQLAAFVGQIGAEEADMAVGRGLKGDYFANKTLSGTPALTRVEAVDFDWGTGSPGTGVPVDGFSVRWTGRFVAPATGSYRFQTESDDGVRLTVNGTQLINNWTDHAPTTDTSAAITLPAGQVVPVLMEYFETGGGAVARLRWQAPGTSNFTVMPAGLFVAGVNGAPTLTNQGAQTSQQGVAVSLQLSASDPEGKALSYAASGLPAGVSINAGSGLISGTPTTVGSSNVTVTVTDAEGATASQTFTWTVRGPGLVGQYFANTTLSGTAVLTRSEAVDFNWGSASPGAGVPTDNYSVRWTGSIVIPTTGSYRFQTESDDGVRLTLNGSQVINNWTDHSATTDTTAAASYTAGQVVTVVMEYYEKTGSAVARLRWLKPGATAYEAIPIGQLRP